MIPLLEAMRPRQWTKNLLVFGGLIFSGRFMDAEAVKTVVLMFAAFCMVSSSGYLVNDIRDRESDRNHPEKKDRPIASGRLSVAAAWVLALVLIAGAFALAYFMHLPFGVEMLAAYALNQTFYTNVARGMAILDVFIISTGFLIRAVSGAAVLKVFISPWLLLCTFLLALFLGFAKRKHEFELGTNTRDSLVGYSKELIDQLLSITAAATVISYCVYAIDSDTAHVHKLLVLTIPFPVFGVFRYLQLVYAQGGGGNPDKDLLRDAWLGGTVLIWAAISLYAMSKTGWGTP